MSNPTAPRSAREFDLGNIDSLTRYVEELQFLRDELPKLRVERERLGRFKEIDQEEARLGELKREAATILTEARETAKQIIQCARQDTEKYLASLEARERAVQGATQRIREARDRARVILDDLETECLSDVKPAETATAPAEGETR